MNTEIETALIKNKNKEVMAGIVNHMSTLDKSLDRVQKEIAKGKFCNIPAAALQNFYNKFAMHTNEALKVTRQMEQLLTEKG